MNPPWLTSGFDHIWLPYTQMQGAPLPAPVVSAKGCTLTLADGQELIDGISSWWCMAHGYQHPYIIEAVEKQLHALPHVMFGGIAHEPAYSLAERLVSITPNGLERVFFSDSGSTAVEVAMKMALQYWRNQQYQQKDRFLCFTHGYHGDTFGAMSISDPARSMHKAFMHTVMHQFVVDIPTDEYAFSELDNLLSSVNKEVAAMVIEPLVQGAGGMYFHSPDILAELHRLAKKHGILFIADEIATGFGRTGHMFACNEADITPDIMCLGKALTGGTIGMGATLATDEIYTAFLSDKFEHALMHGPTFMANPLACAAAHASLDLFEREPRLKQVEAIEQQLIQQLTPYHALSGVKDIRVKGAIGVVELEEITPEMRINLRKQFIEYGCWIRPVENVIYLMPPLVITEQELRTLTQAIATVLNAT